MFSEYMIIAIFYILGIIFSKHFDMSGIVSIFLAIVFTGVVRILKKKPKALGILILAFVFLFGAVRYFQSTQNRLFYEFPDKYVTVTGRVTSPPDISDSTYKYRYVMTPDSVSYLDKTAYTNSKILVYTKSPIPFGAEITASGFLSRIDGINNEHEFDFSLYYKGRGVFARFIAYEIHSCENASSLSPDLVTGAILYTISNIVDTHFDSTSVAFLKAILMGDKSGFPDEYATRLIKTGIWRTLYTPFVHISLIFMIAGLFSKSKDTKNSLVIILLLIYCILNLSSPTIIKAAMVCGLVILRKQLMGFASKADIMARIVLIMTIFQPLLLFHSGFLMSVASSVIIYFSYTPIYIWFLRKFKNTNKKLRGHLAKLFSLWVIFVFGTLPICIYLFGGVSVYATFFTLIITPIVMLVLILSPLMLISLAVFGVSPVIAPIIAKCMDFIGFLPILGEQLPAYYITLKTPTICDMVVFYLLWWGFLRYISGDFKTPKTAIILLTSFGICISCLPFSEYNTLSVYFVNVGQGDGAILHTSRSETVLIDGGGSADYETNYNIGERVFVPYLVSHGFNKIDVAILSHYHKDHAEGIIAAANTVKINTLVMPETAPDNIYRLELEKIAEEKDIKIEYLGIKDEILFDSGLKIRFIAPANTKSDNQDHNDASLVAHVSYGEFSALFTGDSKDKPNDLYPHNIDILKVSHHGSDTGCPEEFLDIVNPKYAVISVGKDNSYNLPSENVIARLFNKGAKVLRTDKHGDIQFKARKDGRLTYKTLRGD